MMTVHISGEEQNYFLEIVKQPVDTEFGKRFSAAAAPMIRMYCLDKKGELVEVETAHYQAVVELWDPEEDHAAVLTTRLDTQGRQPRPLTGWRARSYYHWELDTCFRFPDLCVLAEGKFRLKFSLAYTATTLPYLETLDVAPFLAQVFSNVFQVTVREKKVMRPLIY